MERNEGKSKTTAVRIVLILMAIGLMASCTQSLFLVKGNRNKVNQKSENNTEVSVDSTDIKTEIK